MVKSKHKLLAWLANAVGCIDTEGKRKNLFACFPCYVSGYRLPSPLTGHAEQAQWLVNGRVGKNN